VWAARQCEPGTPGEEAGSGHGEARSADNDIVIRHHVGEGSLRSPQWFDSAHQADILAAFDTLLAAGLHVHGHGHVHAGPRPERVRELGQLAAASALPARAALLRWGALPPSARSQLLTGWYGSRRSSSAA
jgi:hypothetical protein